MSEGNKPIDEDVAQLYESAILGLRKKGELLREYAARLTRWSEDYTRKIQELTGLDMGTITHMDMDQFSSPDPITQLEINNLTATYKSRLEREVHQSGNYCKAINRRLANINSKLIESGRQAV